MIAMERKAVWEAAYGKWQPKQGRSRGVEVRSLAVYSVYLVCCPGHHVFLSWKGGDAPHRRPAAAVSSSRKTRVEFHTHISAGNDAAKFQGSVCLCGQGSSLFNLESICRWRPYCQSPNIAVARFVSSILEVSSHDCNLAPRETLPSSPGP